MSAIADQQAQPRFMSVLEAFLQERFNYKRRLCQKGLGPTISVSCEAFILYLRFKPQHYAREFDRPLVIAKMIFDKTQCGHGTALLCFVVEQANAFDIGSVMLESTNNASSAFAQKRGFISCTEWRNTWFAPISHLRSVLPRR